MKTFLQRMTLYSILLVTTGCGTAEENDASSAPEAAESNQTEENTAGEIEKNNAQDDAEINESNAATDNEENEPGADNQNSSEEEAENIERSEETDENTEAETDTLEMLEVHFIDAGQADATLFAFEENGEEYHLLYDTGDWNNTRVYDYITSQGISKIDVLVGSHPHADHIGQMDHILENIEVGEVWMSGGESDSQTFERVLDAIAESDAGYDEPSAGDTFDIGPLTVDILHPASLSGDLNDDSLTAKFVYGNVSFLLTGDVEANGEAEMLSLDVDLNADVLQLGHHGSNTSTTPSFYEAVDPLVAVVSAGENNSYGHPHREVVERVNDSQADLYATFTHGTVIAATDGNTIEVTTERAGDVDAAASEEETADENNAEDVSENENAAETPAQTGSSDCIDINSASLEELEQIIHIGPARAEELSANRPFDSLESLTNVDGIAAGRLNDIIEEGNACVN